MRARAGFRLCFVLLHSRATVMTWASVVRRHRFLGNRQVDWRRSQFNGTSTPKGPYSAKTGDNDCNVNSSCYSLSTALCESNSLPGQVWTKCPTRPDTQGAPVPREVALIVSCTPILVTGTYPPNLHFFFQNVKFLLFCDFFSFSLVVNIEPYRRKKFKRHVLWKHASDSLPKIMHTPGEGLYQSCSKNCEILDFAIFFSRFR